VPLAAARPRSSLYEGSCANLPGVDYVVVSARRKPGWEAGAFVMTPDQWYTLGTPFEMRTPDGRLRTVYPLTAQTNNEVLRRGVHYELPPLRRGKGEGYGQSRPSSVVQCSTTWMPAGAADVSAGAAGMTAMRRPSGRMS
jgi:hypothetical protein